MSEQLSEFTTLRLGGPADLLLTHTDPAAWPEVAAAARRCPGQPFTLGGGSNTLAGDIGYAGPVIRMATTGISASVVGDTMVTLTVQAGQPLAGLVAYAAAERLSGIEYLAGIPGSAGAAPVQNTGAYGQQIADTLTAVTAYDWRRHRTITLPAAACRFGYRTSLFKIDTARWTILTVTLRLTRSTSAAPVAYRPLAEVLDAPLGTRPDLAEAVAAVLADRRARGLTLPASGPDARQAGSVFLNPSLTPSQAEAVRAGGGPLHRHGDVIRASAGWLLQHCGHHPGQRLIPGVYCSNRRTLTLVARDGATSTAFSTALRTLAKRVLAQTGIRLRPEPAMPGPGDPFGSAF